MREGVLRNPLCAIHRRGLLEHLVHLLKGQALGLGDEEERKEIAEEERTAPDEENLHAEISHVRVDHVWGDDCDDAVPEPVRGGGQCDALSADRERIQLPDHNPRCGAPGHGERGDVEARENDQADVAGAVSSAFW